MPDKRIGLELRRVNNLLKRRAEASPVRSDLTALTGTHGYVLGFLAHRYGDGALYQRDIEQAFSIRPSTATVILQRMEQNGLIVRETDNGDARCKRIVLTEKALTLHHRIEADHAQTETVLREGLTEEELNTFFAVMDKLKNNLERRSCT